MLLKRVLGFKPKIFIPLNLSASRFLPSSILYYQRWNIVTKNLRCFSYKPGEIPEFEGLSHEEMENKMKVEMTPYISTIEEFMSIDENDPPTIEKFEQKLLEFSQASSFKIEKLYELLTLATFSSME